jgi:hypothetical protein
MRERGREEKTKHTMPTYSLSNLPCAGWNSRAEGPFTEILNNNQTILDLK